MPSLTCNYIQEVLSRDAFVFDSHSRQILLTFVPYNPWHDNDIFYPDVY